MISPPADAAEGSPDQKPDPASRLASLTAFATLGALTTAQHVAGTIVT
ncbi:MAG: hypothetical protein ACI9W4_003039, partial [Rhodothermales bacterium]